MRIISTICNPNRIDELLIYCDGILLSNDVFSSKMPHTLSSNKINELSSYIKSKNKEVYLSVNVMVTDITITTIESVLCKVNLSLFDGFIISDIGMIEFFKNKNLIDKVIYNPETLMTNHFDFNYFFDTGIKGAFLSNELTVSNISSICKSKKYQSFMIGFGHINIFTSRRKLISNFEEIALVNINRSIKVEEEFRSDLFPVFQDNFGTHMFRSNVLEIHERMHEIKHIDYLVINGSFLDFFQLDCDEVCIDTARLYKNNMIYEKYLEKYSLIKFDQGFLDKTLDYKKVKND